MIEFSVNETPMGSVRMTQRSKWKDANAKRYLAYKERIGWEAKKHIKEPINNPVKVKIACFYPIPNSWSKKKREEANLYGIPTVKPDIDNVVKGVFDALNKIAWKDDNLVYELSTFKRYSYEPKIIITIQEVSA